jgi:hypothetical protein
MYAGNENSAFFEIDVYPYCWSSEVGLGYDDNSNGRIENSELGIGLGFSECGSNNLIFRNALGTQVSIPGVLTPSHWSTIRVVFDFTANSGEGSASVFQRDITAGATVFTPVVAFQNINMHFNQASANHRDPRKLNAMYFYYDSDGRMHDNFRTGNEHIVLTTSAPDMTNPAQTVFTGTITNYLNDAITQKGIVWSTTPAPALGSNESGHTISGAGSSSFTGAISNNPSRVTYYVRAYATNASGTSYGNEISYSSIPTLPEWGLIALGAFILGAGGWFVSRRFV